MKPTPRLHMRSHVRFLNKTKSRCFYCSVNLTASTVIRDHKYPKSRFNGQIKDNIAPSCWACNSMKSARTVEEFTEWLAKFGIQPWLGDDRRNLSMKRDWLFVTKMPKSVDSFIHRRRGNLLEVRCQ